MTAYALAALRPSVQCGGGCARARRAASMNEHDAARDCSGTSREEVRGASVCRESKRTGVLILRMRRALALPADARAAPSGPRFRARRAVRAHDDARRTSAPGRHLGASPPLNMWVRTAPRGDEHSDGAIDIVPRGDATGRGLELLDR